VATNNTTLLYEENKAMPKKDFSQDANDIFPFDVYKHPEVKAQEQKRPAVTVLPVEKPPAYEPDTQQKKLVRATFYITEELEELLGIRSSKRGRPQEEKDRSAIVRTALSQYLGI
jgi:hypothetical protein